MTRDELESLLWHHMPRAASAAVDVILAAADAYASAPPAAVPLPVIHWQKPGERRLVVAACHGRRTTAQVTTNPARVTCGTCRESRAWQRTRALAVAV